MPTIIDSLFVELGLDPKGFDAGSKKAREALGKLRGESDANTKAFDAAAKKQVAAFASIKNEVMGLVVAVAGASSVKDFMTSMITGDAATGRLAANLGMATEELSAWQLAAKQTGGAAQDAEAALRIMAKARTDRLLTGKSAIDPDLAGLGLSTNDYRTPTEALLKLAEASERMDKTQFFARLQRIGIPESQITLLAKGRAEVEAILEAKRREAAVTQRQTEQAQALTTAWANLQDVLMGKARPALYAVVQELTDLVDGSADARGELPALGLALTAVAGIALAAGAPFVALAAAISAAILAYQNWDQVKDLVKIKRDPKAPPMKSIGEVWDDITTNGLFNFKTIKPAAKPAGAPAGTPAPAGGWGAKNQGSGDDYAAAYRYFRGRGISEAATWGILAGMHAEGGGTRSKNPNSSAKGWGQWLTPRQTDFAAWAGHSFETSTREEQWGFILHEMQAKERSAGSKILGAKSAREAGYSYIKDFMRPKKGYETNRDIAGVDAYLARAGRGGGGAGAGATSSVNIGTITVNTQATDANGIAGALGSAIRRRSMNMQASQGTVP